jgi:phage tail sheath protein FI
LNPVKEQNLFDMPTYRTPGSYVEEISTFPPSVAAVETAIPAFIGYTEKASFSGENLDDKPVRINSLLEFEERYGGAPPLDVSTVTIDANNNVVESVINSTYYLYDSLRLFFSNGGGKCYIISVGTYPDSISSDDLGRGLQVLSKVDEPTLIVFPDGVGLSKQNLADLYKDALEQCYELKDRFLIADVHMQSPGTDLVDFTNDITDFRNKIGTKNLSYAASYYPYLRVSLPRAVRYRDIKDKVFKLGTMVGWTSDDADTQTLIDELNEIVDDQTNSLEPDLRVYVEGKDAARTDVTIKSLEDEYLALETAFLALANDTGSSLTDLRDAFTDIMTYIYEVADSFVDTYASDDGGSPTPLTFADFVTDIQAFGGTQAAVAANPATAPTLDTLAKIDNRGVDFFNESPPGTFPLYSNFTWNYSTLGDATTGIFRAANNDVTAYDTAFGITLTTTTNTQRRDNLIAMQPTLRRVFYGLYAGLVSFYEDASNVERQKEASLFLQMPVIKNIAESLQSKFFILPPCGAIAGVYASVDGSRGVFKAPANVSLNAVVGPTAQITISENDDLNVDVTAGKSINAIRAFAGKGTLVWGSRTLAGNDNEWRYVPVRRFFIFAEESIKKATEPFVFEPNDANTWAKVKSMISNFLTLQWRDGALQGAKPDQAFYVKIGLGETMTAQDILEGRMIVEIGMAVVRPAEFIILRFAHKLPEA